MYVHAMHCDKSAQLAYIGITTEIEALFCKDLLLRFYSFINYIYFTNMDF